MRSVKITHSLCFCISWLLQDCEFPVCFSALWEGKLWVVSGVWLFRVYYSAISDLPQYRVFFLVFSVRDCSLRNDSVDKIVGS